VDRLLVELAQNGDEEAFAGLVRMAGDRLMSVAYQILRDVDRAEDAVQLAIVSAWRELPSLRDPDRFAGWLYRMLVHACYAEIRRTRRLNASASIRSIDAASSTDDIASVDDRDQLDRAFRRLQPELQTIFVFHHHLGMRLAEIAETLDLPVGTVKSRLHAATATLRAAIDADARTAMSVPWERPA
jgi:RNA polymerase sigma-70 factor, ECF subfamily